MARHVDIQCILLLALHNSTVHPGHVPNRPLKTLSSVLSSYWTIGCVKFDQSSVKYTLRNTENYNHQWLSDSSRVHQIRFRTGLRPERHWGSLLRSAKPRSRLGTGIPPPNTPTTKVARSLRLRCSFGSNRPLPAQTPQLTHFPPKTEGTRINTERPDFIYSSLDSA